MYRATRKTVAAVLLLNLLLGVLAGCGTTKTRSASDQLLMSDAVDRTVAQIDFSVFSEQKVYFDTTYLKTVKGSGWVNADYVISSLRQQMVAAGCLLQDDEKDADFVLEARMGALGTDGHNVTYGIPASTGLTDAASLIPSAPRIPMIPEISLARKEDYIGAAKIGVFAYDRENKRRVWQSGIAIASSSANDAWVLGAGPIQYGTIYDEARFAGDRIWKPWSKGEKKDEEQSHRLVSYYEEVDFEKRAEEQKALEKANQEAGDTAVEQTPGAPRKLPVGLDARATPVPPTAPHITTDQPNGQSPPAKPQPPADPKPSPKPPSPAEPEPSPTPPPPAKPQPSPQPPPPSEPPAPGAK
jgi:hypothetical protein